MKQLSSTKFQVSYKKIGCRRFKIIFTKDIHAARKTLLKPFPLNRRPLDSEPVVNNIFFGLHFQFSIFWIEGSVTNLLMGSPKK